MADDTHSHTGRIDRRKFLGGLGAGAGLTVAGCIGDDDEPVPEGTGTIQVGMVTPPDTLNPLVSTSAYASFIWANIYDFGTTVHPEFGTIEPINDAFRPWALEEFDLDVDNIGTSEPAMTATLREDLEFNDGEPVTAEDVVFSIDYIIEQQPGGTISAAPYANLEEVTYDSPDGYEISYFLEETELQWFTGILGSIILPEHIWSDVDEHSEYDPLQDGDMVGSGSWEVEDYAWEEWFEINVRNAHVPQTTHPEVDWVDDEAPYLDGWDIEVFGSETAAEESLMDGEIDTLFFPSGASIDLAIDAQEDDGLDLYQSPDSGYYHNSYNMRRVPYDDVAFRQFLVKSFDKDWVVEEIGEGIAAEKGDYVVIPEYDFFRPDPPWEADEYEGIDLPALEFPTDDFSLDEGAVQELRDFLENHPDAVHDYSWEEASSDQADPDDGLILHVNGEPLEEAHTDNDGNTGQGPLEMISYPPDDFPVRSRYSQRWVEVLNELGVPTELNVMDFTAATGVIYVQEDFDMFTMGWGLGVAMTHLVGLYSSEGADLEGDAEVPNFNAMGYTGADDLIFEDAGIMDFDERTDTMPQVCAQIWRDAPTEITQFHNLLEPVNNDFVGWQDEGAGSVVGDKTTLNVRLED